MCWSYNSCTIVTIVDVTLAYCLFKDLDNLWLKSPYILSMCIQLAVTDVYHGLFIAVTVYAHLSTFKFGLGPLT